MHIRVITSVFEGDENELIPVILDFIYINNFIYINKLSFKNVTRCCKLGGDQNGAKSE